MATNTIRGAVGVALLLISTVASAEMVNPVNVSRQANGWTKLVYPKQTVEPGEVISLQLCLRATKNILSEPRLNILPDSGRGEKVCFIITNIGFFPHEDPAAEMIPYSTHRIENVCDEPQTITPKIWVREER